MPPFPNLSILTHPLIQHKLTHMRRTETSSPQFRQLMGEIALLMGYEVTRALPTTIVPIQTPEGATQGVHVAEDQVVVVPILRAGLVMADGLLELMPTAKVGHIGLYRDHETKRPIEYLVKLPAAENRIFILVDPMLATGYSAAHAIDVLLRHGVPAQRILFLTLVSAPEGMAVFNEKYSHIRVYTASLDAHLNEKSYIMPGLGDAGDRLFGTE